MRVNLNKSYPDKFSVAWKPGWDECIRKTKYRPEEALKPKPKPHPTSITKETVSEPVPKLMPVKEHTVL